MASNPFSLNNKTIFITGSSSGIGRATAIECSKMGANVIITGRNTDRLNDTYSQLVGKGHLKFRADLTNPDEMQQLLEFLPDLDGFVVNAGIVKLSPVKFIKNEDLYRIFQMNSIIPIMMTRDLVKFKKMKRSSSIVYTSSTAGNFNITPGNGMYSSSKAAINGFMKSAAVDLASKGIRCNSVNPALVKTPMMKLRYISEKQLKENLKKYPLGRYGTPEEVAYAIIYLLSDASAWVTGTSLLIDGGLTLT